MAAYSRSGLPEGQPGRRRRRCAALGRPAEHHHRAGQGADQDRRPPLALRHDGDLRSVAARRRPDGRRGDQRQGRRAGQARSSPSSSTPPRTGTCSRRRPSSCSLQDKVAVTFGCWTSVSRKSVLPVFENNNGAALLPGAVRGRGGSKNVFYTGASAEPAADPGGRVHDERRRAAATRSSTCSAPTTSSRAPPTSPARRSCWPRACPRRTSRRSTRRSTIRTTRRSSARSSASPPAATPACSRRSTATATCPSTRSSPTRACAARTPDHGVQRGRGRAARHGHLRRWSATWPPGTTTSRSTRPRTRSS